ncbi:MAG: hypothetical protein JO285_11130 [Kutzneria sp.]|nr:hypothetical protein [Kutzneria sp.]
MIKDHAVAVAMDMRERGAEANDLLDRLAADNRLPLGRERLAELLADRLSFTGVASTQVAVVADEVAKIVDRFPDAAEYRPRPIL